MHTTLTQRFQQSLVYLLPLAVVVFSVLLAQSSMYQQHSGSLSLAITLDLLLTAPLLHFLLIRKKDVPKFTVISFIVIGTIVATFALPEQDQLYLTYFKTWFIPVLELGVFTFLLIQIRKTIRIFKSQKSSDLDFLKTLRFSTVQAFGEIRVAQVLATEVAVIYYAFFKWRKEPLIEKSHFTYHKKNGSSALYIALICILAIEILPTHILLERWSVVAAWVLTFGGAYTMIQVLAHLKAVLHRPIRIEADRVILRNGIMADTEILFEEIESIDFSNRKMTIDELTQPLSLLPDLEPHNMIIKLKTKGLIQGPYGIKKEYQNVLFYVDDKEQFKQLIGIQLDTNDNI